MDFTDQLKEAKPNAKPNTIKTYNTILRTMYKNVFGDTPTPDVSKFANVKAILEYTKDDLLQTRKTKLSAIVALVKVQEYTDQIFKDAEEHKKQTNKSEMTEKLEAAEITADEMAGVVQRVKMVADALNKKSEFTMRELQEIQSYIIVSLYHGHIVPRRAIDFTEMVLKPTDKKTQNYLDLRNSKLVFNNYKTAGTNGKQEVAIPPALKKIISKWVKLIPDGVNHLLFNSKKEPLSNVTLNQRLNEIFGATKGVNSLRHYYLTQNHSETVKSDDKLAEDMVLMGSNIANAKSYIKVNPIPEK
jgi:Trp operon repressor